MADGGNIKVVVRCRPLNSREKARGADYLIDVTGSTSLVLQPPAGGDAKDNARATKKKPMPFAFDRMFPEDTEQSELFQFVGEDLIHHAFAGFNTCVFAYGQTGSGKSHSMVGYAEQRGLIPLVCSRIFEDIATKTANDPHLKVTVEVSYMEIYNEKVHDLLNPKNKGNLKVREHPSLGPYVEDLSRLLVNSYEDIDSLLDEGNKARTIASTNMNATSSRSHAVITLVLTQKRHDVDTNLDTEKVSRISLVDLAGSERANSTGATGDRLKEGANINRSLTTLGKVIAALAGESAGAPGPKKKTKKSAVMIPYRDSTLTWLLKDSLGGNSKTAMIAAISPADYEETLSTLRYADQAKKIQNKAVVNEDPNAKLIRELKEELELLRAQVSGGGVMPVSANTPALNPNISPEKQTITYQTKSGEMRTMTKKELQEQLEQSEKLMKSLDESWEDKMTRTDAIHRERERVLEELGISISHTIAQTNDVGLVHTPKSLPHLVNLNEDPLMNECLIYQLKSGKTVVGNAGHQASASSASEELAGSETGQIEGSDERSHHKLSEVTIPLSGPNIRPRHCIFTNEGSKVTIQALPGALTMVNGQRLEPSQTKRLRSGYRVILGDYHVFRFNHPEEVRKARDRVNSAKSKAETGEGNGEESPSSSESEDNDVEIDWTYARAEAALARLNGEHVDFGKFDEAELEKLMEDVRRARIKKRSAGSARDGNDKTSTSGSSGHVGSAATLEWTGEWDDGTPWNGSGMRDGGGPDAPPNPANLAQETEVLRARVQRYEQRLAEAQGASKPLLPLSSEERKICRLVLAHWHMSTPLRLAHDIQQGAVLVFRAMRAAVTARQDIRYQLTIIDREPPSAAASFPPENGSGRIRDRERGQYRGSGQNSDEDRDKELETILGLEAPEDIAPDRALTLGPRPCVAVQVLDLERSALFVWSLQKMEAMIPQMEHAAAVLSTKGPNSTPTISSFSTKARVPPFCFIGAGLVPLLPVAKGRSAVFATVPLRNPHTNKFLGTCRVRLTIRGVIRPRSAPQKLPDQPLPLDSRLAVTIEADEVTGLECNDFDQAHIQVRRESLTGEPDEYQLSYASDRGTLASLAPNTAPISPAREPPGSYTSGSDGGASAIMSIPAPVRKTQTWRNVRLRKTVDVLLTPASVYHLTHGYLAVELFGSLSRDYLRRIEACSEVANSSTPASSLPPPDSNSAPPPHGESDMGHAYYQSVILHLEIQELGDSGDYEPVQVESLSLPVPSHNDHHPSGANGHADTKKADLSTFFLRQGSQRKLVVRVQSEHRGRFTARRIVAVRVGDVCLVDGTGTQHKSSDDRLIPLPLYPGSSVDRPDGVTVIQTPARWDFTSHQTLFLDRLTRPGQHTSLQLQVDVEADVHPAHGAGEASSYPDVVTLDTTLRATVHPPDATPSQDWRSWVGQASDPVTAVTELFDVQLVQEPKETASGSGSGSGSDLARCYTVSLPTAANVRSSTDPPPEETPPPRAWRPRGLSLLRDYADSTRKQLFRADVEATRMWLDIQSSSPRSPSPYPDKKEEQTPPPTGPPLTKQKQMGQRERDAAPPGGGEAYYASIPSEPDDVWASSKPDAVPLHPPPYAGMDPDDPWAAPDPWQSEPLPPTRSSTDRGTDRGTDRSTDRGTDAMESSAFPSAFSPRSSDAAEHKVEGEVSPRCHEPVTICSSSDDGPASLSATKPSRLEIRSPQDALALWDKACGAAAYSRMDHGAVRLDAASDASVSTELGRLCQVPPVLLLYAAANSYSLLARNEADLHGWLHALQAAIGAGRRRGDE